VKVRLAPHISEHDLRNGLTQKDICVNQAENRVHSEEARCGAPNTPKNNDEISIRKVIHDVGNGFKFVDETVERIRLIHLVTYPVDKIECNKSTAVDKIKDAIEHILPCFVQDYELKRFEDFLSVKLSAHPGFERTPRRECRVLDTSDHDYYITNGDEKYDVFQQWSSSILDAISKSRS